MLGSLCNPCSRPRNVTDEALRANLMAIFAGKRVRLHVGPRYCSRCDEPCDLKTHRYCKECRRASIEKSRDYRERTSILAILFHTPAFQAGLAAIRDEMEPKRRRPNVKLRPNTMGCAFRNAGSKR